MVDSYEFVDFGAQGEYGLFGKVVAKLTVGTLTPDEVESELWEMREMLGSHLEIREVEVVPAC